MEMNSQQGEINEMRDQKNIVGYHVGRVKTVAVKRAKRIMSAKKPSCRCHLHPSLKSKCASKQEINSSISNHEIFMSLNPLLLAFLQVDYHNHPANVWGFLAGTCLYFLALELKMKINTRSESYSRILGHVLLISGALSSFSLLLIFLRRSPGWLPFIILPFMIARPLLVQLCHWLFQVILKVTPQVGNFLGRLMRSITVQQQQLPN